MWFGFLAHFSFGNFYVQLPMFFRFYFNIRNYLNIYRSVVNFYEIFSVPFYLNHK